MAGVRAVSSQLHVVAELLRALRARQTDTAPDHDGDGAADGGGQLAVRRARQVEQHLVRRVTLKLTERAPVASLPRSRYPRVLGTRPVSEQAACLIKVELTRTALVWGLMDDRLNVVQDQSAMTGTPYVANLAEVVVGDQVLPHQVGPHSGLTSRTVYKLSSAVSLLLFPITTREFPRAPSPGGILHGP